MMRLACVSYNRRSEFSVRDPRTIDKPRDLKSGSRTSIRHDVERPLTGCPAILSPRGTLTKASCDLG
jgi:hypothetical protein